MVLALLVETLHMAMSGPILSVMDFVLLVPNVAIVLRVMIPLSEVVSVV